MGRRGRLGLLVRLGLPADKGHREHKVLAVLLGPKAKTGQVSPVRSWGKAARRVKNRAGLNSPRLKARKRLLAMVRKALRGLPAGHCLLVRRRPAYGLLGRSKRRRILGPSLSLPSRSPWRRRWP